MCCCCYVADICRLQSGAAARRCQNNENIIKKPDLLSIINFRLCYKFFIQKLTSSSISLVKRESCCILFAFTNRENFTHFVYQNWKVKWNFLYSILWLEFSLISIRLVVLSIIADWTTGLREISKKRLLFFLYMGNTGNINETFKADMPK